MTATIPDLEEFYQYSKPKRPPCRVGYVISQLKPADRKAIEAAFETDKNLITAAAIIEWLKTRGFEDIKTAAGLGGHRKHSCTCYD